MPVLSVRNLPAETHRALKLRAAQNNRSTEAEVRAILVAAVRGTPEPGIGSELAAFAAAHGGLDWPVARDPTLIEPADFG